MHLSSLVEMVESGFESRWLFGEPGSPLTGGDLGRLARAGSLSVGDHGSIVYVGENDPLLPVALFAAVCAGVPFVPVNYRLEDQHLNELISRQPDALVLADAISAPRISVAAPVVHADWLEGLGESDVAVLPDDDDAVAIILFTSGTTSAPKSALLRHRHLMSYLLGSVEFGAAGQDEAVLISVPPYHIAGMANMLSNLFAGRRLVYLSAFDADRWLDTVRTEGITHAMVVPTMLARIIDALDGGPARCPTLRSLSYGGAKISERVLRRALEAFPDVGFVNAYGLTETASTIAVLGPEDHRAATASDDPVVRRRLASAGKILPMIDIEVRADEGTPLPPGDVGLIHLRGEQIAGEYATGSLLDQDGWFCTRDRGWVDDHGYLYIEGRADDTIIRGGENIAPAEIEEVLLADPSVAEACVVGVPDDEWGQRIVAVVVPTDGSSIDPESLREQAREELRGSKTPDVVVIRDSLPHTETGKLLRRVVLAELSEEGGPTLERR